MGVADNEKNDVPCCTLLQGSVSPRESIFSAAAFRAGALAHAPAPSRSLRSVVPYTSRHSE